MRLMRTILPVCLLAGLHAAAAAADGGFSKAPLPEPVLGALRGGFALPGGLDVAIAVQSETRIDGATVLRTSFVADQGAATLVVYGRTDAGTGNSGMATDGPVGVTIEVGEQASGGTADGLARLALGPAGVAHTIDGKVEAVTGPGGAQVTLSTADLDVTQLAGQAYGSIAVNRGDDVAVDVSTQINLDLRGATPFNIGSTSFRVEALGTEAAASLAR